MKIRPTIGFGGGVLIVLSSAAHAFLGWPPLGAALRAKGAGADLLGAVKIGWWWGSATMLASGLIVLLAATAAWRGRPIDLASVRVVGAAFALFGIAAFLYDRMNPHFLLFIGLGGLVLAFAWGQPRRGL